MIAQKTPRSLFPTLIVWLTTACLLTLPAWLGAQERSDVEREDVEQRIDQLEEPMYTPFVELYLLEESKALRKEMQNTRAVLIEKVVY